MKLHFRAIGNGPPLIILHGLLGSLDNWAPVAQKLAAHFQILLPDLRNHGQSPHTDELGYDEMAEDLLELLNEQQIETAHVMGHSMGGKVAMHFAQLHPGMVSKLVVVDIAPREYPPRYRTLMDAMLSIDPNVFKRREEVDLALRPTVPDKDLRQFLLKNLGRDQAGHLFWKPHLQSIRVNYDALRRGLPTETKCHCPALFVRGEKSDYVQESDFTLIHQLFSSALIETIPGAGHWVHANAPDRLIEIVLQFLLAK